MKTYEIWRDMHNCSVILVEADQPGKLLHLYKPVLIGERECATAADALRWFHYTMQWETPCLPDP